MKRFAVTHINKDGMRTLSFGNQGRNHYDTFEDAAMMIDAMRRNNSPERIAQFYGTPDTLEVRDAHGDAKGIYFNT